MQAVECPGFDEEKYVLGSLCRREHEWGTTGKSLRYIYRGRMTGCVDCARKRVREWQTDNPERHKAKSEESRVRTRDRRIQRKRERYAAKKPEREAIALAKKRIQEKEKELFGIQMQFLNTQLGVDTSIYTLGKLCKHKHYYEETEFSLRYIRDANQCVACRKISRDKNISRKTYRVRKRQVRTTPYTFEDLKSRLTDFDFRCAYCEKELIFDTKFVSHDDYLNWDHVVPISKGGIDAMSNLLPACRICNLSKSKRLFGDWYNVLNPIFSSERLAKILEILQIKSGD